MTEDLQEITSKVKDLLVTEDDSKKVDSEVVSTLPDKDHSMPISSS